jgi:hypothetical protein
MALCVFLAAAGLSACLAVALLVPVAGAGSGGGRELLPDLDVATPSGLVADVVIQNGHRVIRLSFASAASNVGEGPLDIRGHRATTGDAELTADQIVVRANGKEVVRPGVGRLRYVEEETHEHWHLLPFMRYELRRASDYLLVVPDRKTGFCLGDRVDGVPDERLPGEPPQRVFNTNCSPGEREILDIEEGISVGWADVYEPWRDGQYLDVTGLPAGRYMLVHRVNPARRLVESRYGNNASSLLLAISWPNGKASPPQVQILKQCPQTQRCPPRS